MAKSEYIQYLRNQACFINELADQLERGEQPTIDWAIDLAIPDYEADFEQRRLNAEINDHIEKEWKAS